MNPARSRTAVRAAPPAAGPAKYFWFVLPLLALVLASLWLITSDWLRAFDSGAPPVEKITFERTILDGNGIHLKVRAAGSEPIVIAQVQVDEAYWRFTQEPAGALDHFATAWLHIPYPWVLGEKHEVKLLSKTGATFVREIEVAVPTPKAQIGFMRPQAILGAFVGILPVAIGMLFFPALRGLGGAGLNFVLALTVGLLAFLFVDTLEHAFELAGEAAETFQGPSMVLTVAAVSAVMLIAIGRRGGTPTGLALAAYIALGIGLHNFGEGLAIGAAYAAGIAGLGAFLVLGFTLHNVTEGIGIVAPLADKRPPLLVFVALALLAGGPAIPGIWLGSLSYAPQWAAFALAIGAGAILQVILEVSAFLKRQADARGDLWLSPATLAGFVAGVAIMYLTAMLVKI